jgi:hypothetical protein
MRVQHLCLLAVAVAAGLSLTACAGDDSSAKSSGDSSASADTRSGSGTGGSDTDAAADSCKTSQLGFSSSHGMAEGQLVINLKNNGAAACTLQGFPGVDLKGKDGSISATRSDLTPAKVGVKPGEETRFTLNSPPNTSGGTGATFTSLSVTPPNETHSHSLPVSINVPASDGTTSAIKVDPVGSGK